MHPIPTCVFFLLLFSSLVAATNFTDCLINFKNNINNTSGGVDSNGHQTSNLTAVVGLTYETCTAQCGKTAESFDWREFAQLFASWLLPWLALVSQLPFGSGNYEDDFISVILSVGSPALAAYSLALTSLNVRSVYRKAQRIENNPKNGVEKEVARNVARALTALQQTSLELTKDDRLLDFITTNDQWRREIADRLSRRNSWSVATGSSVAWVVIAFLFTLVDSFVSLSDSDNSTSEGHAVGTLWLWLLCLVIGWLWVPTFTHGEVNSAIDHANRRAVKKAAKAIRLKAHNIRKRITKRIPARLLKGLGRPAPDPVIQVTGGDEKSGEKSIQEDGGLLPNLPHNQSTTGSQHGHPTDSANPTANPTANHSIVSLPQSNDVQSAAVHSIHPDTHELLIRKDTGSLNRNELRFAATFNYSRVMRYHVLVSDVWKALEKAGREEYEEKVTAPIPEITFQPTRDHTFPKGVWGLMFCALIPALILQCGTTAAAIIIIVFTPTIGLGCRSLAYIIYGGTSVVVMLLAIISTIFARISETRIESSTIVKGFTKFIAITLRRVCFLLALTNAVGLIVISCFQFSHFLDNCYCNASVIGRGTGSYIIIILGGWIATMRDSRIAGTTLSAASMAIYMIFLALTSSPPAGY